ncbi:MAG TPA: DUF4124 domain-containing protein [Steroidobacteraceae bacterium]|nr:DUF4124 domain-containing protein [Steroidobacteraceae bacterium]
MARIFKVIAALAMAGIAAVAGAETVYKWIDGSGQVHYTDLPPRQADAKILGVYQQEAGVVEETESGDDYTEEGDDSGADPSPPSESPRTPEPPPSAEAMAAAEADAAKAQVLQCKEAQDRYQRYIESRRLFRETPDGKRVYLTDKELTEARARAKQAVDDYCS